MVREDVLLVTWFLGWDCTDMADEEPTETGMDVHLLIPADVRSFAASTATLTNSLDRPLTAIIEMDRPDCDTSSK